MFLFFIAFAVVALRLVWLQVISAPDLAKQAEANRTNVITLTAKRGTIYDRNGNVLAMSVDCKTVYCNPKEVSDSERVAEILSADLGGEVSAYKELLEQDTTFVYLYMRADDSAAEQLLDDLKADDIADGIYTLADTKRVYPYGATGVQVLGFVGSDGEGLTGLEYQYNDILSGTDGEMRMEVGADGTPVAGGVSEVDEAQDGTDIVVSLDVNIQQTAEDAIANGVSTYYADSGSVVVMDPSSGEILAMCSTPTFDPTDTSSITNEALQLKPITDSYEPGSIFKVLTLTIGIDAGIISPDTNYTVPAQVQVGDDMVSDDDDRNYSMDMSVREIMRRSSNTGAILMANSIGADTFAAGVEAFGIGSTTGIDLPGESGGIVTKRADYAGNTLGAMSFGQAVSVPMIQMVRAIGAVANDGVLVTPHLLVSKDGKEVEWKSGDRVCSQETATTVTDVLRTVAREGTGTTAQVAGFDVVGKTGTAEMVDTEHGGYLAGKNMASMIGWANGDDPQVLVYVGLNGTPLLATDSSAYVFSTIMSEALGEMGVSPSA